MIYHFCPGQPSHAEMAALLDSMSTPDRKTLNNVVQRATGVMVWDFNAGSVRGVLRITPATLAGLVWDVPGCGMSARAQGIYGALNTLLTKYLVPPTGGISMYNNYPGAVSIGYASPSGFDYTPSGSPYIQVFGPPARDLPSEAVYVKGPMQYTNDGRVSAVVVVSGGAYTPAASPVGVVTVPPPPPSTFAPTPATDPDAGPGYTSTARQYYNEVTDYVPPVGDPSAPPPPNVIEQPECVGCGTIVDRDRVVTISDGGGGFPVEPGLIERVLSEPAVLPVPAQPCGLKCWLILAAVAAAAYYLGKKG
jgi:hypothetical protein